MVKKNACVFISGRGSNLKNLIQRSRDYNFPIKICLVVCNNRNAKGINYAKKTQYLLFLLTLNLTILKTKYCIS